nr:hypothetical protein [Mycoplasmopsis bovis]
MALSKNGIKIDISVTYYSSTEINKVDYSNLNLDFTLYACSKGIFR